MAAEAIPIPTTVSRSTIYRPNLKALFRWMVPLFSRRVSPVDMCDACPPPGWKGDRPNIPDLYDHRPRASDCSCPCSADMTAIATLEGNEGESLICKDCHHTIRIDFDRARR